MQNVTKIPFSDLSSFDIREEYRQNIYIVEITGACSHKALPPPLFEKKPIFSLFILLFFFLHFKTKIPKKKDIMRGDINFIFSFFS